MTGAEYREQLVKAYDLAVALVGLDLDEMRDAMSHAEAFGPFIDPTLWHRKIGALKLDAAVVSALTSARARLIAECGPQLATHMMQQAKAADERADAEERGDASRVLFTGALP